MKKSKRKPAAMRKARQPKSDITVSQLKALPANDFITHNYNALHNMYLANKDWKPLKSMSQEEIARRYSLRYDNQYIKPTQEETNAYP